MNLFLTIATSIFVVFPFIVSIYLYIVYRWLGRPLSVRRNADYTTPFLFLSVYVIAHTIFGEGTGYWILIATIVTGLLFAIYEKVRSQDFAIGLFFRKMWRLFFIVLVIAYVLLMITSLVLMLIDQA